MNQTIRKRIEDINNGIVPEGYKQTPFGIFPCDWETDKTYGELFEFNGSLSQSREELGEEGYAYLHYGDMHRNSFNKVSYEQYSRLPKVNISLKGKEKYLMKDGDVAFLDASEDLEGTSRCVLIDNPDNEPFFAGLHTIPARETGNNFSKWYKQYITLPDFVKKQFQRLACGFKVYGLNKDTIAKIDYVFPKDKAEQGKIAEILMKWDEAVELQEQYIQKLELRKKAIMKKLLTSKDGWKKCRLNELVYKEKGKAVKIDNEGNFPIIDMEYLDKGVFTNYTNEKGILANEQDILLLWDGASAGTLLTGIKGVVGSTFALLTLKNDKTCSKYLYYWLTIENVKNASLREGSGIPHMPKDYLQKQVVKYPILDKQIKISKTLALLEEEISLQKEKLAKIKGQRKAMQQYLLTGIVRV